MYIPWDPPLMLHIANLLMDSIVGFTFGYNRYYMYSLRIDLDLDDRDTNILYSSSSQPASFCNFSIRKY